VTGVKISQRVNSYFEVQPNDQGLFHDMAEVKVRFSVVVKTDIWPVKHLDPSRGSINACGDRLIELVGPCN
jgi:hypothetical protein